MKMKFFLCMFLLSYLFVNVNSNTCQVSHSNGITNTVVESQMKMIKKDTQNFLDHMQENLQEIRRNFEHGSLPATETIYYYLFTPNNPNTPYTLKNTVKSLRNSYYDNKYPLVLVLHGFQSKINLQKGMLHNLKNALLSHGSHNVLFINYTTINQGGVFEAFKKSYIVSKELVGFLKFLKDEGGTPFEKMHLIGASLGAHVAGNAGHKLPGIGRITALDAAGDVFNDFPEDLKLTRDDAFFVDVLHTADAEFPYGLGYYRPIGHLDFYINGGIHQPGCENVPTNSSESEELKTALHSVCMHIKALKYYTESVCETRCVFIGYKCESYQKFEKGLCTGLNSVPAVMGHFAKKPLMDLPKNEMFFLNTNAHFPFCKIKQP